MPVTKETLIEWATHHGWHLDKHGHLQKETDGRKYRLKLSRIAARYEVKAGDAGWIRIRSAYYHQIGITPEGKLAGLSRAGCGSPAPAPLPTAANNNEGEQTTMRTFAIALDNSIAVFESHKDAKAADLEKPEFFTDRVGFARLVGAWPMSRLVELWNKIPGVTPVKKFTDRKTAINRVWQAIEGLGDGSQKPPAEAAETAAQTEPTAEETMQPTKAKKSKDKKAKAPEKAARSDSKKAKVMKLIVRAEGATNMEIQKATEWQPHTVRGFLSIAKKSGHNIEVIKRGSGDRAYHLIAK